MKDKVEVLGVNTLNGIQAIVEVTRRELERASRELNEPDYIPQPGDLFKTKSIRHHHTYQDDIFLALSTLNYSFLNCNNTPGGVMAAKVGKNLAAACAYEFLPTHFTFEKVELKDVVK